MVDNLKELKQKIESIAFSEALLEVNLYQVNDNFFELPDEGFWIIDAGIELKFLSGTISAAWSSELEHFVFDYKPVKEIYTGDNLCQLQNENILGLNKYVGKKIYDVKFKSLEFEYVPDYTMRIEKEEHFVELILEFEDNSQIQIAFVNYELQKNKAPRGFSFSIITELLIATKQIVEIK